MAKKKKVNKISNSKKRIKNLKNQFSNKKEDVKKPIEKFLKTGIKGFDSLFEKGMGIPNGAAVLVEGGPGSGKTIFCLAAANELCKKGKKCLYMSFEESEEQLIGHMEEFNWKAKDFVKKGLLRITRFDAIDVSRSIEALLSAAKKELLIEVEPMFFPDDFKPDFVVIDSLTSISSAFSGEESRFRIYMEQLFRYLEKNKITNFLIREVSSPSHVGSTFQEQGEAVSFLSDGIIVLYNVIYDSGGRTAAIEILKMRGVSFKKRIVEMKIINGKGLEVNPDKILKKTKKDNFSLT
jgi:circadian clock protein KaiC